MGEERGGGTSGVYSIVEPKTPKTSTWSTWETRKSSLVPPASDTP
jgi:hypothetical protein